MYPRFNQSRVKGSYPYSLRKDLQGEGDNEFQQSRVKYILLTGISVPSKYISCDGFLFGPYSCAWRMLRIRILRIRLLEFALEYVFYTYRLEFALESARLVARLKYGGSSSSANGFRPKQQQRKWL